MPDTGPPFNIPFLDGTELVRAYPGFSQSLAEQVADALAVESPAGLVAVKHALKTNAEAFTSIAGGGNASVPGLSISHAVANASNRLIITAFFGAAGSSRGLGNVGIAVTDGSTLIGAADAVGVRTRLSAGGVVSSGEVNRILSMPSVTFVYTPGSTSSRTYTVRIVNIDNSARTLYVNRTESDSNEARSPRAASALVIQEVTV
jgi:hypothetical protein